jgi:hypothetical protein
MSARKAGVVSLLLRIDTPIEAAYFSAAGILPYVLKQLLARCKTQATLKEEQRHASDQAHI